MALITPKIPIQSTAGAVPLKNEKGELYMEKVKVSRYVSGKRPDYAPDSSDEDEEDLEFGFKKQRAAQHQQTIAAIQADREVEEKQPKKPEVIVKMEEDDEEEEEDREQRLARRRRHVQEPEILERASDEEEEEEEEEQEPDMDAEDEEELDEEEIERRRALLRIKSRQKQHQQHDEEVLEVEEEKEGSEPESSEYESEWESEEEDTGPRLKPVFVRKKDRITIQEKELEAQKEKEQEVKAKRSAEDRRKQTLKMVAAEVKREIEEQREKDGVGLEAVDTDDENDEEEYEAWKVRELKRIKRDRDEREQREKDQQEIEQVHTMTKEERCKWQKDNPKLVTNQAKKGKYRFLQKYYHRGVFYLDEDNQVFKRDFATPTLEDHFHKDRLPKVMQVKNFGRSGRTKYTHLVDQDTTQFDSPWVADTAMNLKFHTARGGGMKQSLNKPSLEKK